MKKNVFRRIIAFILDYMIIAMYALLLLGITTILNLKDLILNPINGQLVGFVSLTLPVFFYFYLLEKGRAKATIGKRIMNLHVDSKTENTEPKIFLRNILKFLPWEIAHVGVHWIIFFSKFENDIPIWMWFVLIVPQVMMFLYFVSIIVSGGESSIYDRIANTKIKYTSV